MKPSAKPANPHFSSGPCSKRPGYDVTSLRTESLGRSHRSGIGKKTLQLAIDKTRQLLGVPEEYKIGIVPASDTGAVEMAMWSLLGPKPVDVLSWESFGGDWASDIKTQLKLDNIHHLNAAYGALPHLAAAHPDHDIVFTWNGTTSGVKVPHADWISDDRSGLTICDATSAVFAMDISWRKLDVVTFSWQKVLGGEGAHGMLILSPRAVERLESYTPAWPLPKIFRLTKAGKLIEGIFRGETINTPSMLCVADYLDTLHWVEGIGGLTACIKRSEANLAAVADYVAQHDWLQFLAQDSATISSTSICLTMDASPEHVKAIVALLADEKVGFDIGAYRDAPAGLRIWGGATVDSADTALLMQWIGWAYSHVKQSH